MGKLNPSKWVRRSLSLLCTMTLGLSLMGSPLVVYADDYTYIPVQDWQMYNAYKFWAGWGYQLDQTQSISYTESLSGTMTYTGVLNGSFLGSESGSYTVSLTGQLDTLEDATYISGTEIGHVYGGGSAFPGTYFQLDITPVDTAYESNGAMTCTAYNPIAHTYNNETGWNYDTYRCTYGGGIEAPEYEIELGLIALATNNSTAYEICISETQSGGGSLNGSISLNESATTSGSGTISLSGTTSTTGHKVYDIPVLNASSINNSFSSTSNSSPTQVRGIYFTNKVIFAFLSTDNDDLSSNADITQYNGQGTVSHFTKEYIFSIGAYYLHVYRGPNIGGTRYITLNHNYKNVIPIFIGTDDRMSDDLYRYLLGTDRTRNLLENGTSSSQAVENTTNSTNTSFNTAAQSYETIENTFNSNMNTALNNVSTTSNMLSNNKFLSSANWVRVQFERIVLNTPFELLIVYCLILGLALVLIGKVR